MARTVIAELDVDGGHVSLKQNDERFQYAYTVETKRDAGPASGRQSHTSALGRALDLFREHLEEAGVDVTGSRPPSPDP